MAAQAERELLKSGHLEKPRRPRPRAWRATLAALGVATLHGCVQDDGSLFNPLEMVAPTIDDDAERELGMEFDRELEKHVEVIQDDEVASFLSALGQSIVETLEPQPFVYRFRVVVDPSLNAFAVPGGFIYFHSGTVLAASNVDELAGVMGHEIAHVKAHHYARMRKQMLVPDLLASLAGVAAAVATQEPGLMVASQAVNVALQLSYSREFETEADELGGIFMARAGYDPAGISRFFERIEAEQRRHPHQIPPYLYSHPEVKDRIATVTEAAEDLGPLKRRPAGMEEALLNAQARLARLAELRRTSLPRQVPPANRERSDPLLEAANDRAEAGQVDSALIVLARAEALEPFDPRLPFRAGELLFEQERYPESVAAYQRTLRLDNTRAQVFYRLGLAHKETGTRHRAIYAFEQAVRRAGEKSVLRERANWEIEKLTFLVVAETGFADGSRSQATRRWGSRRSSSRSASNAWPGGPACTPATSATPTRSPCAGAIRAETSCRRRP